MTTAWIEETASFLVDNGVKPARFGIVLGSGLGGLAEHLQADRILPYTSAPHFVQSTAPGHRGMLHYGRLSGQACLVMSGRCHFYEGYDYDEVTFPIRVMRRLGVEILILTNAAGAICRQFRVGDLMLVRDHIGVLGGFSGAPARSPLHERPEYYSNVLLQCARNIAIRQGIGLQEGTLAMMKGPSYETPAELEMLRRIGTDAVTMSTIPEVIAAWREGMRVLAISCISNLAFGLPGQPLDHREVIAASRKAEEQYIGLLKHIVGCPDHESRVG